jgi:2-polyprenyl-3-methyl-5-hydroxy-6-metoxy-1,4-benzoquinol methylase
MTERRQRRVLQRYSGRSALRYDEKRRDTPRYKSEEAVLEEMYSLIEPRRVLDVPVGTGRWLEFYASHRATVTGLDLSQDMLDIAATKVPAAHGKVQLRRANLLDLSAISDLRGKFDLIVCVRFLNWLSTHEVELALSNLSWLEPRNIILGAHIRGQYPVGYWLRIKRIRSGLQQLFGQGARHFLHDEGAILSSLSRAGFALREKRLIASKAGPANFFYLFERAQS